MKIINKEWKNMKQKNPKYWRNITLFLLITVMFMIISLNFLLCKIEGKSMYPTLQNEEYILVNRAGAAIFPLRHGEIVIIKKPNDPKYYVKRIIGLPKDKVKIENDILYINGKEKKENYIYKDLSNKSKYLANFEEREVPSNKLFVMGDNRYHSKDSRNGLGYIDRSSIVGTIIYQF
ncbi:signal peptidase I [Bacillus pseudomycoides]|uniref:signal peptidase I n=1 Tax=Bacillus TaxID=1386 RepID=UPI000373EB35|nr:MULTISPECIES: signal peptidase I [Bacillus]AIK36018.1 signal peptidase I [Bacillus pseudomycoides]AJI18470.1 signal peptidase I [Bacillus pseudomycoides]MEB3055266.1 signal peptidase I [Bacillus pseudomycoides]